MRRHEERMIRAEAAAAVAEAVAMVQGRLLVDGWGDRPNIGWTALNTLAHGDRALLRQIADGPALERGQTWDGALRYLAGAVIAVAGPGECGLMALQRAVLVPLELRVLGGATKPPVSAAELVRVVLHELDPTRDHPSWQ
jgi:hypothetical protein